ncbi:MAG: GNAT family N-acetyltransferase [Chloroflexota bacterium]|nr:GNAT family N-acetyltransferase [Chloroflexota bacterium]
MFSTRPFNGSSEDYEAIVAIRNAIWPDMPVNVSFQARRDRQRIPEHLFRRVLVIREKIAAEPVQCVAFAEYGHMSWAFDPRKYYLEILILPDFQQQGIGGMLYDHIIAELQPSDPRSIDALTREDKPEGQRFLEDRGFQMASRSPCSVLDPAAFEPERFSGVVQAMQDSGITIRTFGELDAIYPDHLRRLFDLDRIIMQDIPWHDDFTPVPFEHFAKRLEDNPNLMPNGFLVALDEDRYIGLTNLWASEATDTILYTGLTGVLRDYRRQGIATALKVQAISYAKSLTSSEGGPPEIRTDNHEDNPMFLLNLRFGFQELPAWLEYRKSLE